MAKTVKRHAPQHLQEALEKGWKIDEELSTWQFDGSSRREGLLLLKKPGGKNSDTLTVPFLALYATERPYFTFHGDKP